MDQNAISILRSLLGIGFGTAVAIAVLLYIVKASVAKAVELAGQKELEKLKAELGSELEAKKAEFARELDRERSAAARELEQFKAELSLVAEVRRQVAARKVQAAQDIMTLGEPLIRTLLNSTDPNKLAETILAVNQYTVRIRETAHYFREDVARALYGYSSKLLTAKTNWERKHDPTAFDDASKAYDDLLRVIREELGIQAPVASATKASDAAKGTS